MSQSRSAGGSEGVWFRVRCDMSFEVSGYLLVLDFAGV